MHVVLSERSTCTRKEAQNMFSFGRKEVAQRALHSLASVAGNRLGSGDILFYSKPQR